MVEYFYPHWGSEHLDFSEFCAQVAAAGYDGVEMNLSGDSRELKRQRAALKTEGLELLAQHSMTRCTDFQEHLQDYTRRLTDIAEAAPCLINVHTGRDWYGFEQNVELLESAMRIAQESGTTIIHETHRGRFSFCAAVTRRFLEAMPALRLCADFSHWCNVSESLLEDQEHFVEAAIQRADMIHARIGFGQGPQVNDPRAPEWQGTVERFLGWWDRIVKAHRSSGSGFLPITTEFGPAPYLPLLPYTQQPVASQWEMNLYMLKLLKTRYS